MRLGWAWFVAAAGLALAAFVGQSVQAQGERCGAGRDLVVQALERVTPASDNGSFEDALQLLKHAVSECGELGDAWYYRSLVEKRLGHDALAKYSMEKARFNGSEAMDEGLNPLVLATPEGRGFGAVARPGERTRHSRHDFSCADQIDHCSKMAEGPSMPLQIPSRSRLKPSKPV